ncbi:MAG: penicillin-binding protein 1C [Bosea sp. (in: a-proteobacteria)]
MSGRRTRAKVMAGTAGLGLCAVLAAGLWLGTAKAPALPTEAANSTVVLDRNGRLLRAFATEGGRWRLPLAADDVDARYLKLLQVYEDKRFGQHWGVDPLAMLRAGWQGLKTGRTVSGGSTLTMQVARLLEPEMQDKRSVGVKLRQSAAAIQLERQLSKREILDLYLRLAPYGGNLEGLRAASLSYFGKEPKRLSLAEAAMLVALPQSPETRRPDRHPETLRRVRDRVIARAVAAGLAGPEEAALALSEPVPTARLPFPMLAAHAAERVVRETPEQRVHQLAIDRRWQVTLEALLRERVDQLGSGLAGAILVVEHASGKVRAHVGSSGLTDKARAGAIDMAQAVRSPGSALKPFIYALAFENGTAHPETILDDRPNRYGSYAPGNFDLTFQGTVTARLALQQSLNLPAITLLSEITPQRLASRLTQAGAGLVMPRDAAPGLAIGLGGAGIRLADLAVIYAGIARGGMALPLNWLERAASESYERYLTDAVSAWYVGDILRGAPPPANAPGGRIAYKTGTSYGYRDGWAIGFDARHTVAVWLGRPDNASVPGLVARQMAAPLLFDAFARIGMEPDTSPAPREALVARSSTLPPPLRHVRRDVPKTIAATVRAPIRIAFPPDGAQLDMAASAEREPLPLKAHGGVMPLTWLVDNVPVVQGERRRESHWLPEGAGFARISVMDATGATDSVQVRLQSVRVQARINAP